MTILDIVKNKTAQTIIDMVVGDDGNADDIKAQFNACNNLDELLSTLNDYGFDEDSALTLVSKIMETRSV